MQPLSSHPILRRQGQTLSSSQDILAEEVPIALVYNGISHAVLMASPQDLAELAIGFSLSEGILSCIEQLYDLQIEEQPLNAYSQALRIELRIAGERFHLLQQRRRHMSGRSSCGLCGIDSLQAALPDIAPVARRNPLPLSDIQRALADMDAAQILRRQTGSLHAAAWAVKGDILALYEDVGRHNALDKLLGHLAQTGFNPEDGAVLISSRASYEMIAKAAGMGISCLVAVSAATALALRLAEHSGICLIGYARPEQQNIYTHPEHIQT